LIEASFLGQKHIKSGKNLPTASAIKNKEVILDINGIIKLKDMMAYHEKFLVPYQKYELKSF